MKCGLYLPRLIARCGLAWRSNLVRNLYQENAANPAGTGQPESIV